MVAIPKLLLLWMVLVILLFWIPALLFPRKVINFLDVYAKNEELWRLLGILILFLAFLLMLVHVGFDGTWYMVFSILWRLSLLKGIWMVRWPKVGLSIAKSIYGKKAWMMIMGVITILLSLFLLWIAIAKI